MSIVNNGQDRQMYDVIAKNKGFYNQNNIKSVVFVAFCQ